jgi:rhodanese-related sulfurtransferase
MAFAVLTTHGGGRSGRPQGRRRRGPSQPGSRKNGGGDGIVLVLLACCALGLGWALNHIRADPLPLSYQNKAARLRQSLPPIAESAAENTPLTRLSLEEFSACVVARRGVILDVRPKVFHELGHVPGALSLPREDFEHGYAALRSRLESDRGQSLILYCSGGSCEDSLLVARALADRGFTQLAVFEGGWEEWTSAGKPEEGAR